MAGKTLCVNIIKKSRMLDRCSRVAVAKRTYSKTASAPSKDDEGSTHFGFQTVKENEKAEKVHNIFENIADSYDIMNDVMSMGIHRIWKDVFMQELGPTHGTYLLDSAGGTGDITFRYINFLKNTPNPHNVRSHVTVCDINQHMLDVGKKRAGSLGLSQDSNYDIVWKQEDAEKLSFPDDSFSAYTIAFGIRNVTHIDKVLSEAYRVLQPGGRFLCLEFSHVDKPLQWLYDQYSFQIIPVMGQLVAGQWKSYQYLVESIRRFPNQEDFKNMIEYAGFRNVTYQNLTFGVTAIHSGFKL